jgi:large repetitive protein
MDDTGDSRIRQGIAGGLRSGRQHRRGWGILAAGVVTALVAATVGGGAALAAADDTTEAEGLLLSGGGLVNLDSVVNLAGAYTDNPPGGALNQPINLSALGLVDLGLGVQLFGGNNVLNLGAVGQYSSSNATTAYASSGAVGNDGAIVVGSGAPTTLNLTPTLNALSLQTVVSQLQLELDGVAASATSTRALGTSTTTSTYQIVGGQLVLQSPALVTLLNGLSGQLATTSANVNALAGAGGTIDTTVGGLTTGLASALNTVLGGVVTLPTPTVSTSLNVDLGAALNTVRATPLTSGPVQIDLSDGTVRIDLDAITALDGPTVAPNTEVISQVVASGVLATALSNILTVQFPGLLQSAINAQLISTAFNIQLSSPLEIQLGILAPVNVGTLNVQINGNVGSLLGVPGAGTPVVTTTGSTLLPPLGLDPSVLLTPVTNYVLATVMPAVNTVVQAAFNGPALATAISTVASNLLAAMTPVLNTVAQVVQVTVNVQQAGDFRNPNGLDGPPAFTQRAASIVVAPTAPGGLIRLNLASATVRAAVLLPPTGLAMAPTRGPVTGGTPVVISGTNLGTVTGISFGGVPAAGFTYDPVGGTISTTAPPQAAPGPQTVTVTNPDGSDTSLTFDYFPVTVVDTIDPDFGSTAGGNTITLTGVCFTGATEVQFGGVSGTNLTVVDDTELTVVVPAGTAGIVDMTVVNPTECGDLTIPGAYTYVAPGAPLLTSITPPRGTELGGTTVTIIGVNFDDATAVTFGGVDAGPFTIVSDTEITATTPAHAPGVVDVVVTNPAGDSAAIDYEYFDVTDISGVAPSSGPLAGGNTVVITGTCFTGATAVFFGPNPSIPFTVDSATQITATVPAGTVGAADVTVLGAGDCGIATAPAAYEYIAPPVITSVTPTQGPETGGTLVTLTGTGFLGTTAVLFDGTPGTGMTVVSDTEITVMTPAETPGTATVMVDHPGGDVVAGPFVFLNVPTISGIAPAQGPEDGGTTVVITGEGFTGTTDVTFDGVPVTYVVDSDTQITVTTPPHAVGTVPVVVVHPNGNAGTTFTYVEGTEVTGVTPTAGPDAGGNTVTITGVCFTGATNVLFGAVPATSFAVVSDTEITATAPAGTGVVNVTVVGAAACGTDSLPNAYQYVAPPVVTSMAPTDGPETGGTVVVIQGSGFSGWTTGVLFDTTPGTDLVVLSDTAIQVTAPAHLPGIVPVTVQHVGGNVFAGPFEFLNVPTISGLTPPQGPEDGGTVVVIAGEGFTGATGVTFDGVAAASFVVDNDGQITVVTPPHVPGTVPVVVQHPNGNAAATFAYVAGTEVSTVTPPGGPEVGGTVVTIVGQCFTGATNVLFGTTPATSFSVVSDTQITAVAPAGVGIVDVTIVGAPACGTDVLPGGFEYTDDPVIGTISPDWGPRTGGTVVTITGANLGGVTRVTFNGVAGTGLTVVDDTELVVTTPAGAIGEATIVLTGPTGASRPGMFMYVPVTSITGIDPATGPTGGGTSVTLQGACFAGASQVLFGSTPAAFRVVNGTTIVATAPASSTTGAVNVTVVGSDTCGSATLSNAFTYRAGAALAATGGGDATGVVLAGGLLLLLGASIVVLRRRRA